MIKIFPPKYIRISTNAPQNLLLQINSDKFQDLNNQGQWCINGDQFETSKLDVLFSVSQKIHIDTLVFKNKKNHLFLYNILTPKFQRLTFIKLCDNHLTSIEPLSLMYAPILQEINVSGNKIMCLKPLVKLYSPNINEISIDKNNLINPQNFFRHLTRCPLGGQQKICQMIKIQTKSLPSQGYPSLQCQDLSFMAKLHCQFLIDLKYLFSTRIQQENIRKCRHRKNHSNMTHRVAMYQ